MALCGTIKHHNKNEKPCVLGFWHFLTSERIAGFSASLSAEKETDNEQQSLTNSMFVGLFFIPLMSPTDIV